MSSYVPLVDCAHQRASHRRRRHHRANSDDSNSSGPLRSPTTTTGGNQSLSSAQPGAIQVSPGLFCIHSTTTACTLATPTMSHSSNQDQAKLDVSQSADEDNNNDKTIVDKQRGTTPRPLVATSRQNTRHSSADSGNCYGIFEEVFQMAACGPMAAINKSVIIHRDENGLGLQLKGQSTIVVDHVHEDGAAWRAGLRENDIIVKINGQNVARMDHQQVVKNFKNCARFVAVKLASTCCSNRKDEPHQAAICNYDKLEATSTSGVEYSTIERLEQCGLIRKVEAVTAEPARSGAGFELSPSSSASSSSTSTSSSSASSRSSSSLSTTGAAAPSAANRKGFSAGFQPLVLGATRSASLTNQADNMKLRQTNDNQKDFAGKKRLSPRQSTHISNICRGQSSSGSTIPLVELNRSLSADSVSEQVAIQYSILLNRQPIIDKRRQIIKEFIETEKAHAERLLILDELFHQPLKEGGFLKNDQMKLVFSCHKLLYAIHRRIYRILSLANRANVKNPEPLIGWALIEIFEGDLMRKLERAACSFCKAQSINMELLNKITRKDTKSGELLWRISNELVPGKLGIKDLLASCFQRITKYPLLLESLHDATSQIVVYYRTLAAQEDGVLSNHLEGFNQDVSHVYFERIRVGSKALEAILSEERNTIYRIHGRISNMLVKINEAVSVTVQSNKLKDIWKKTEKHHGVPLIDITKQRLLHDGNLTLRAGKRSFDVHVLLLVEYIIILMREGQDKYRLKFFSQPASSSSTGAGAQKTQRVCSPIFVVDEHLTTRDAAVDETGFYLLCKRKDDSRIYEFAARSPADRVTWRAKIQLAVANRTCKVDRRSSITSAIIKSGSETSFKLDNPTKSATSTDSKPEPSSGPGRDDASQQDANCDDSTKVEGTISYVEDDGVVMPSNVKITLVLTNKAVQSRAQHVN